MKSPFLIEIDNLTVRGAGAFLLKDISFKIKQGECWAVAGASGSGKSTLLAAMQQYTSYPDQIRFAGGGSPKVAWIRHQHTFKSLSGSSRFYYQQRFNAADAEDSRTVLQELTRHGDTPGEALGVLSLLQISYLQDTPLIQLSNGEHKRFQIAEALLGKADWLLLDNPYTGLDVQARNMLDDILLTVMERGVHVFIACQRHLPEFVTHVARLQDGILTGVHKRASFLRTRKAGTAHSHADWRLPVNLIAATHDDFSYAVKMKQVSVRYHDRTVLDNISWQVRNGESWNISGPNGSGKSTLLSLITGDNPQAFAHEIFLFDRRRGTGETIWEIKRKIGYVSPELHYHFDKTASVFETVASGLFDTIGLFRKLDNLQHVAVDACIDGFHLREVASRPLSALSHGMQRWVLLARAVVKNPPLFILDEPCQGLDEAYTKRFVDFVQALCEDSEKTLLYVSHVNEEIPDCITRFLKLDKGNIIEINNNGKDDHGNSRRRHRA